VSRACLLLTTVLLAAAAAAAPPQAGPRPSLLLVTFDTTNADRIGAYGDADADTPTIDALASAGVLFEEAVTPTPITLPSHASLLTGVAPSAHGVRDNGGFVLGGEATLLSEVLREHGWRTGAFVGSYVLGAATGLDQGFEVYRGPVESSTAYGLDAERPASQVVDDAIAWLGSLPAAAPFFAWVHFYDPHYPHTPPLPWSERLDDPYDAEIAFCDAQLGRLLAFLAGSGRDRNLVTAVTADHGESLGRHGEATHGVFLYQSVMRVPLVVAGPPLSEAKGTRVSDRVSSLRLAPTLLALAGLPADAMPKVSAASLFDASGAPDPAPGPIALETFMPFYSYRWRATRGLVHGDEKYIAGARPELYDLARDPEERRNLAPDRAERVRALGAELDRLVAAHPPLGWEGERSLSSDERALLESLGYVSPSGVGDPFDPSLPDPRQRIGDLDEISRAIALYQQAERVRARPAATAWQREERDEQARAWLEEARGLLQGVRERTPHNPQVPRHLGLVEGALGNYEEAVQTLDEAVRLYPAEASLYRNLAAAYYPLGRRQEAKRAIERAIALAPGRPSYHHWLAQLEIDAGDLAAASRALDAMMEAARGDPRRYAEASRWLEQAQAKIARRGRAPEPGESRETPRGAPPAP
jgi:arylsulfatase A-like enzyme/Flp pilus assembly protein TadD